MAANEPTPDTTKLTLSELRNAVNAELAKDAAPAAPVADTPSAETAAPKADEVPATTVEVPVPAPTDAKPMEFSRVVEVNGKKRTFKADSLEGLVDQLVKAQESTVKKLQALREESSSSAPAAPAPTAPVASLSPDDLFTISQELTTDPASAFSKLLKAQTGMTADELRASIQHIQRQQSALAERSAAETWLRNHPEYIVSQRNAKYLMGLAQSKGGLTYANIEAAYDELVADKVLDLRSDGDPVSASTTSRSDPATSTPRKPVSGMPVSNAPAPAKPDSDVISEKELTTLPLSELRAKLQAAAYAGKLRR